MLSIRHLLAVSAVAAIALTPVAATADDGLAGTFLGGTCNGQVDSDCQYCSYEGGNFGYPRSSCDSGSPGFYTETCGAWTANNCIVG